MKNLFLAALILIVIGCNPSSKSPAVRQQGASSPSSDTIIDSTDDHAIPLSSLQTNNQNDLMIPIGQKVVIDTSINVRQLMIHGDLHCPRSNRAFTLAAENIMIMGGKFLCGTEEFPFSGELRIALKEGFAGAMGKRALGVMNGGHLELYGLEKKNYVRLARDVPPGARSIVVDQPINSWKVGDQIAISTTGFDPHESVVRKILEISSDNRVLTLDSPLTYQYNGLIKNLPGGHQLDDRAYVANLDRNIEIYSHGDQHLTDKVGGHIMIMPNSIGKAKNIKLRFLGQQGIMGRYPWHWHINGDAEGEFFKNSTIVDSYQRCVTIHDTHYTEVSDNVCFNHFGHGYFLESGAERKNILKGNLAVLSKRIDQENALLHSEFFDNIGRASGPSAYWISNLDNIIEDNISIGSEGSGFWMALVNEELCADGLCSNPITENTLAFNRNISHSSKVGITWDLAPMGDLTGNPLNPNDRFIVNAHYRPTQKATNNDLLVTKSTEACIYVRGDAMDFKRAKMSDCLRAFFVAYSQRLEDSVIIGNSGKRTFRDNEILALAIKPMFIPSGFVTYDGPAELVNVDFVNFSIAPETFEGVDTTSYPITGIGASDRWEGKTIGLRFFPEPFKRLLYRDASGWYDEQYSTLLRDLDGSLTGAPNAVIVHGNEFNTYPGCREKPDWNANICFGHEWGMIRITNDRPTAPAGWAMTDFIVTRGTASTLSQMPTWPEGDKKLNTKFMFPVGLNNIYNIETGNNFFFHNNRVTIKFAADDIGVLSEPMVLQGKTCNWSGFTQYNSLLEFMAADENASFQNGSDFYFKLKTINKDYTHRNAELSNIHFTRAFLNCN